MNKVAISIIIPVYKVENYICECLDSVLTQSFRDFELLLIDDGSPDNCGHICDKYARKDKRIRVIHKINEGVSSARNIGIEEAKGEWICFIDSDDYVNSDYLNNLYKGIRLSNSIVIANYNNKNIIKENRTLSYAQMVKYIIDNNIFDLSAPYSKLYNRNIVINNNIKFPLGIHMGEDGIFITRYLNAVDSITTITDSDYYQRKVENSLSSNYYDFSSEWICYKTWKHEMCKFINKYGQIFEDPLRIVWKTRIGGTFNRCLQSVYRGKQKISIRKQVDCLNSIPKKDLCEFNLYYNPSLIRRKILKWLISLRMFYIYCFLGCFDKK